MQKLLCFLHLCYYLGMKERILDALAKLGFATREQIIKTARIFDASEIKQAKRLIEEMTETGEIVVSARSKLALPSRAGIVRGKVIANAKGFAFVRPTDGGEDVFISERDLDGAAHGDEVLAQVNIQKPQHGRFRQNHNAGQNRSGKIVRILKRGIEVVVGVFRNNGTYMCVVPTDVRFANEIFIQPQNSLNAKTNQKVVVKITRYPARNDIAEGIVTEVLGDNGDAKVDTLAVVRSFGYNDEFPADALAEAEKIPNVILPEETAKRKDYRKQLVFTVDGEDARDFDDAISLEKNGENYKLFVHIADVSHYVKRNSPIGKEAYRRGTSVYFPDYVIPMLPEKLCNNMCSLRPNEDRLTLSVEMTIDGTGKVLDYEIHEGIICSAYRMTYTEVTKILNSDKEMRKKYGKVVPMIENMAQLAKILIKRRDKMGQLDFDIAEAQIVVNNKYETIDVKRKPRELSDRIIEQFMLITNEVIAKHHHNMHVPFVYRVHESPTPEGIASFVEFASGLGIKLPTLKDDVQPKTLQKILLDVRGTEFEQMISKTMLRSMQKAVYYEKNMGHFGLACRDYCHFTSPIRRLPDLTIHRIIKQTLNGEKLDYNDLGEYVHEVSEQSSLTERKADDAERAVDNLKKAEFMSRKIGEEFDGIISGVIETGVFVELENTVEGFLSKDFLPEQNYMFDEKHLRLIGKIKNYTIGEKIRVKVASVDVPLARIDFMLAH